MLMTLARLKRILKEELTPRTVSVADLVSGDVVRDPTNNKTFTIHRITKPKKSKATWIMCEHDSELIMDLIRSDDLKFRQVQTKLASGTWRGMKIIDRYVGTSVDYGITTTESGTHKTVTYAIGKDADFINESLRSRARGNWLAGYTELEVVGHSDEAAERAKPKVPSGTSMQDLVLMAFEDDPTQELSENEIMRRIAALKGNVPYDLRDNQIGYGPFSIKGKGSLVAAGILDRHGSGKNATFTLRGPEKLDWRPEETTPEDYYAV